jgi:protein tyrosine phosphatase
MAEIQPGPKVWILAPLEGFRFSSLDFNVEKEDVVPECVRSKAFNRFMDVLPNPATRVPVAQWRGAAGSDYYNANYVRGADGNKKKYIAAMGYVRACARLFTIFVCDLRVRVGVHVRVRVRVCVRACACGCACV